MEMGALAVCFVLLASVVGRSSTSAVNSLCRWPCMLRNLHTIEFSPVLYLAFPLSVMILTPLVLGGMGIRTSTFCAVRAALNRDLSVTCEGRGGEGRGGEGRGGEGRGGEGRGGREGRGEEEMVYSSADMSSDQPPDPRPLTLISMWFCEDSLTRGITRKGSVMSLVVRYLDTTQTHKHARCRNVYI